MQAAILPVTDSQERNSLTARAEPSARADKRYLTAAAVAELLGVNRATVYRLASADATMPATRLGAGVVRFRSDLLHAWLEARTQRSRRPILNQAGHSG